MHAEMKKNPSRDTCSSSSAAPEATLAAAGAKYSTTCVLMTPALLDRAHGVDLVEPATRHQYIIRGSR